MSNETCEVVRVKAWGKGQGDFVEVNKSDYLKNPKAYEPYETKAPSRPAPSAKVVKLAAERGVDLNAVVGTGKNGAVTVEDVEAFKVGPVFDTEETAAFAVELGLDADALAAITGTGENGAITEADLKKAVEGK